MNRTQFVRGVFWLLLFVFAIVPASAWAQVITIKNGDMALKELMVHGKPNKPRDWKLTKGKADKVRAWDLPGSAAVAMGGGSVLSQDVTLPAIDPKLVEQSPWRLVLAIDVAGKFGNGDQPGELIAAIQDTKSKEVLATRKYQVNKDAPVSQVAKPNVSASSFKRGSGNPNNAFDGNRDTIWHSDYGQKTPKYPHHLTLDFGTTKTLRGVTYVPRADGGNGTVKAAMLQYTTDGERWRKAIAGEFAYANAGQEQVIALEKPIECRGIRLLCQSEVRGADFASCAELIPDLEEGFDGLKVVDTEPTAQIQRLFLPVPFDKKVPEFVTVSFGVGGDQYVVVDHVHLMYLPKKATNKMLGKPNGHLGPDLLGAGSYGFQGMMVHGLPVLPLLSIQQGSPSSRAELRQTDIIVGIGENYFPPGNVAPGFEWLQNSHEALLGRAAMQAYANNGDGTVPLKVLRRDELIDVNVQLQLPKEIGRDQFLSNRNTLEVLNSDLIRKVLSTQNKNGSWRNHAIHTSLGGLALLSTGDAKYAKQIKSAANWIMAQNAEPGAGWYWLPSYSGIFLCEYYLATGDERALPVIERLLRMMGSTFHTSKWGTQTFGHGPKGLPYGNKSLVAVMVHVLVFESLAKRCGFESEIYETLTPFIDSAWSNPTEGGHGGLGYNASYKDQAEFWSRSGLYGLMLNMRGIRTDVQKPLAEIMKNRHPWFRNSHAYGEPGGVLGFIGLSQMNRGYFDQVFAEYQWWFALAWEKGNGLHFTIPHMGAPYMEGPELINNGYGIVTNIHKKHLHVLGSQRTEWLDVTSIPVPMSDVMILQGTDGKVSMRCKIPGPRIYYTIDGSEPGPNSPVFESPFTPQAGSVIRAIAANESGTSKIAERGFGYDKSKWMVVSATGDKDPERAKKRASHAIDGDKQIGWVPDLGEGTNGYPYEFTIDMGGFNTMNRATLNFVFDQGAAGGIQVLGADDGNRFSKLGETRVEQFNKQIEIDLNGSQCRYLKFVFDSPLKQDSKLMMLGEIDIR